MNAFPKLFSPFKLGSLSVKNRMVMSPMETHLCDTEGFVTEELIAYYKGRAVGRVGYITLENQPSTLQAESMTACYASMMTNIFQALKNSRIASMPQAEKLLFN